MELETEQLFRAWLKGQIWKQRLSMVTSLIITGIVILSLWFSAAFLLPILKNTGSLLQQLTPNSQGQKIQEDLFKNLPGQLK